MASEGEADVVNEKASNLADVFLLVIAAQVAIYTELESKSRNHQTRQPGITFELLPT